LSRLGVAKTSGAEIYDLATLNTCTDIILPVATVFFLFQAEFYEKVWEKRQEKEKSEQTSPLEGAGAKDKKRKREQSDTNRIKDKEKKQRLKETEH